jgi:hypothetical protein
LVSLRTGFRGVGHTNLRCLLSSTQPTVPRRAAHSTKYSVAVMCYDGSQLTRAAYHPHGSLNPFSLPSILAPQPSSDLRTRFLDLETVTIALPYIHFLTRMLHLQATNLPLINPPTPASASSPRPRAAGACWPQQPLPCRLLAFCWSDKSPHSSQRVRLPPLDPGFTAATTL